MAKIGLLALVLSFLCITPAVAAVSDARQACIRTAISDGAAARGSSAQLSRLFNQYFDGERIARAAAGNDWKKYSPAQKDAQRRRVKSLVISEIAPRLSAYQPAGIQFLSESGSKVRGKMTAKDGTSATVTWHFAGEACRFVNIAVEGFGSIISYVGREPSRKN